MFYGEFEHALDDKGRATVPSKIREVLTGRSIASLMLTRSVLDPCLALYPPSEWERIEGEIRAVSMSHRDARQYRRRLFSGAIEVAPDRAGRILLPPGLREYAGITREIVFAGVSSFVEIWAKERWDALPEPGSDGPDGLESGLVDLGL